MRPCLPIFASLVGHIDKCQSTGGILNNLQFDEVFQLAQRTYIADIYFFSLHGERLLWPVLKLLDHQIYLASRVERWLWRGLSYWYWLDAQCPCKISAPWLVAHSHFLLMITSLSVPVDRGGSLADGTLRAWRPLSSPFWRLRHLGEPRTLSLSSSMAMSMSSVTSVSRIWFAFWLIYILRCHHLCQRYVLRVFICNCHFLNNDLPWITLLIITRTTWPTPHSCQTECGGGTEWQRWQYH